jgi:long-chain acyl-CoA synthetase
MSDDHQQRLVNTVVSQLGRATSMLTCIRQGRKTSLGWSELQFPVASVRTLLTERGLCPGDRVGVLAENQYEFILLDLACLAAGFILAPFDLAQEANLDELCLKLDIKVLFTDRSGIVAPEKNVLPLSVLSADVPAPCTAPVHAFAPDDAVAIKFTSGSTKLPKALLAKCKSIDSSIAATQSMFHHGPDDKVLVFLPLSLLQQRYWLYSSILYGYDVVVVPPHFGISALLNERPTVVMGVPEFFENLMLTLSASEEPVKEALGGRIRYLWTGSAGMRRATLEYFHNAGVEIYQGYGTNETCIVSKNYPGNNRIGSAGKVLPDKEVILEPDGHIIVKSKYEINSTYVLADPEDNAATFISAQSVATGDLGHIDEDGYLYITGRKKDLLVFPSGKKLHPAIIEEKLKGLAGVRYAVAYQCLKSALIIAILDAAPGLTVSDLQPQLAKLNEGLPPEGRVAGICLAAGGFSRENGLLTSQYKVKRVEVMRRFADEAEVAAVTAAALAGGFVC